MGKVFSLSVVGAVLAMASIATAVEALPGIAPSIPGLESNINRSIDRGLYRGRLSQMEAGQLRNRLNSIQQREQYLINTGRYNSFERARTAQQLEALKASLHMDTNINRVRHPFGFRRF